MKNTVLLLLAFIATGVAAQDRIVVPLGGNAFSSKHTDGNKTVSQKGIENWTDPAERFTAYVRIRKPGTIELSANPIGFNGEATIEFTIAGQAKRAIFNTAGEINIGSWNVRDTGYIAIAVKGISRTGPNFPSFEAFSLSGTAIDANTHYVKNNEGNFFYWGRRGPSVHLNYQVPENINAAWYYNEITVPEGEDAIGSYFMANGFGEGYFGIQVNSATERRILFSVWSPFSTDDPKSIPESHKIKMLKKGTDVYTGEFGNEGSGGQSYLRYNWKAGNTYRFLLHGIPAEDNTTTYTAWFYAPELKQWKLIASFKRPQTKTWLKRFHSFLENFVPETGDITRKVLFNNQWVADADGNWTPVTAARFTTDNTGNKQYRMDFQGGTEAGGFYLRNCGFFSNYTVPKTMFTTSAGTRKPDVDLSKLP